MGGLLLLGLAPLSGAPQPGRSLAAFAFPGAVAASEARDLEADLPSLPQVMLVSAYHTEHTAAARSAPKTLQLTLEVARGDTLMGMLTKAGVTMGEAHAAIESLRQVFSPRDLRPGFEIRLSLESEAEIQDEAKATNPVADGMREAFRLVGLSFAPEVDRDVAVERLTDASFVARTTEKALEPIDAGAIGIIDSSLYEAAAEASVPNAVLIETIKALSFDVDFQRDIQPGDSFEVLYENLVDEEGRPLKTGALDYVELVTGGRSIQLYRFTPDSGFADYFDAKGRSVRKTLMRTPIDGARISSSFGLRRHPILGYSKMHKGTDFAAPTGTPIYAAGNGTVEVAGRNGGYGNYVRIRHSSEYKTAYAHMSKFAKGVHSGARVRQGEVIGYVGTTGRSTGPHLHYEVMVGGNQVDPASIKLPAGETLEGRDLKAFAELRQDIDRRRATIAPLLQVASGPQKEPPAKP
ncbi:MAG: M23 family metallopeptidase [Tistlia sp.]|uniref:peptidoglycan DD-metalloendopeptidase family protein n=1 Tax=Tistlia sp. TaxID=3057121 RepID=UPI0034A51A18